MMLDSLVGTNTYVSSTLYDSAGRMTSRVLGNGLTQAYTYYNWNEQVSSIGQGGRLKNLTTGTLRQAQGDALQNLNYVYDKVGNITSLTNVTASETNTYGYDTLNRLTSWTLNTTTETYSYDSGGNLDVKVGVDLNYNDAAHVHAVTNAGSNTYVYDQNGNQSTRNIGSDTFTLIYNAENQLIEVKKNGVSMATFVYDGDGRRVKSVVNGTTTYFPSTGSGRRAGGHFELTGSTVTKYYFAGMNRIAMRKYTIPQSMSVEYLVSTSSTRRLGDHLGSTSITTDANGAKVSEMRYREASLWDKPCPLRYTSGVLREGELRYSWTAGLSTTPGYTLPSYTFTGQYSYMDDPSTSGVTEGFGLMFYGARMYDPAIGRFTSADTVVAGGRNTNAQTLQDVANSMYTPLTVNYSEASILMKHNADSAFIQGHGGTLKDVKEEDKKKAKIVDVPVETQVLDRYSYTLNNPLRYTDPSGYDPYCRGDNYFGYCVNDDGTIKIWIAGNVATFEKGYKSEALDQFMQAVRDYEAVILTMKKDLMGMIGTLAVLIASIPACYATLVACYGSAAVAILFVEQASEFLIDACQMLDLQNGAMDLFNQLTQPGTPGLVNVSRSGQVPQKRCSDYG